MRYVDWLIILSSCNEELRLPYIYNVRGYEQLDHKNIIINIIVIDKLIFQFINMTIVFI
jgi:hypothetical protein